MTIRQGVGVCLVVGGLAAAGTYAVAAPPATEPTAAQSPPAKARPAPAAQDKQDKPDAQVGQPTADARELYQFNLRIRAYVDLHRKLEDQLPKLSDSSDATALRAHQRALGAKIRSARSNAKVGDLFTPETRQALRRILNRAIGPGELASLSDPDDNPVRFTPKVNIEYPPSLPASTMPPSVLANLPTAPDEVEFRFVGKYLILRDTHADIIVDFMTDAVR